MTSRSRAPLVRLSTKPPVVPPGAVTAIEWAGAQTALSRVDPGAPGSPGQVLVPGAWQTKPEVDTADHATIPDALAAAGMTLGTGGGTLRSASRPVRLRAGDYPLTTGIAINRTWRAHLAGSPRTKLVPGADLDYVLALNGVRGIVEGLEIDAPSTTWLVQDVIRADNIAGTGASVHDLVLRDITVGDIDYVRAISLGRLSANQDFAQIYLDNITTSGGWTPGNIATYQEGVHFGSASSGNVLNMTLYRGQLGGARYLAYLDTTNVTMRDVFFDTGEYALYGAGRGYLLLDGFRVEDCQSFFGALGSDSIKRTWDIRNGTINFNLVSTTEEKIALERAGDLTLENVRWYNDAYPTSKARIATGGSGRGRHITLRHFVAKESPEEIWQYRSGNGNDWKYTWITLEGYTRIDSASVPIGMWDGLYTRQVNGSGGTAFQSRGRFVNPFDGILDVIEAAATPITLPYAVWMQGREVIIRKSGGDVTITPQAGETVGGAATRVLTSAGETVRLIASGTDWMVV